MTHTPGPWRQYKIRAALKTLVGMGYTYHGGELWKPPLGPAPNFKLIDQITAERDALAQALEGACYICYYGDPNPLCPHPHDPHKCIDYWISYAKNKVKEAGNEQAKEPIA